MKARYTDLALLQIAKKGPHLAGWYLKKQVAINDG